MVNITVCDFKVVGDLTNINMMWLFVCLDDDDDDDDMSDGELDKLAHMVEDEGSSAPPPLMKPPTQASKPVAVKTNKEALEEPKTSLERDENNPESTVDGSAFVLLYFNPITCQSWCFSLNVYLSSFIVVLKLCWFLYIFDQIRSNF